MANRFRPTSLDDFVGQENVKKMLKIEIQAVLNSNYEKKFPHTLFMGPSGTGKTTLAQAIASELNVPFEMVQAKRLRNNEDIYHALPYVVGLNAKQYILFIDEIHEMPRRVQEELFIAMEDGLLDVRDFFYKKYGSKINKVDVSGLVVIGATTREGDLEIPFRNRFGLHIYLDKYTEEDIKKILLRAKERLMVRIDDEVTNEVAKRSRGVPRIAISLLERLESVALAESTSITMEVAKKAWDLLLIDELGLTRQDYRFLSCLARYGRMGEKTIVAQAELSPSTIRAIEPYLMELGFIVKTPQGREITDKGKKYIRAKLKASNSEFPSCFHLALNNKARRFSHA